MNRRGVERRRSSRSTGNGCIELIGKEVDGMVQNEGEADFTGGDGTENVGTGYATAEEGITEDFPANSTAEEARRHKGRIRRPSPVLYGRSMARAWRCFSIVIVPMTIGAIAENFPQNKGYFQGSQSTGSGLIVATHPRCEFIAGVQSGIVVYTIE